MRHLSSTVQTWTCAECRAQLTMPPLPPGCPLYLGVPDLWHELNGVPLCSDACLRARVCPSTGGRAVHTPECLAARDAARTAMPHTPARMAPLYLGALAEASRDCPACVDAKAAPDTGAMWLVDYRARGEGGVALFSDRADADAAMARWCMDGEPERVTVTVLRVKP